MRYAVLADIHGNLEALTAVTDAASAEGSEHYLCVGDVVGYGADPTACLKRLRACGAVVVAGNHDAACIGKLQLSWFNEAAKASLLWTRDQLSILDLDEIRRWPLTRTVEPFTMAHASLQSPERFEYVVDVAQAVDTLTTCRTLLCLVGHTHVPCVIEYDRGERKLIRMLTGIEPLERVAYQDDPQTKRYLVNPGSVGQPRDGDPRASVALIDTEARTIMIRRVPYDVAAAQQRIRQAGLPDVLADRLALGR